VPLLQLLEGLVDVDLFVVVDLLVVVDVVGANDVNTELKYCCLYMCCLGKTCTELFSLLWPPTG